MGKPIDWKVVESSWGKYWKHIGESLPKFILGFSLLFVGVVLLIPASLIIIKGIQQKGGVPFFSIATASLLLLVGWVERRVVQANKILRQKIYTSNLPGASA